MIKILIDHTPFPPSFIRIESNRKKQTNKLHAPHKFTTTTKKNKQNNIHRNNITSNSISSASEPTMIIKKNISRKHWKQIQCIKNWTDPKSNKNHIHIFLLKPISKQQKIKKKKNSNKPQKTPPTQYTSHFCL